MYPSLNKLCAKHTRNTQSGNVFLIIIIGVALFGALGLTISRGMNSQSTKTLSNRELELAATDIISFGQKVERAVNRLRRKGCSENEISFDDHGGKSIKKNGTSYNYTNPNSPSDFSCHVFQPNGGGITAQLLNKDWVNDGSTLQSTWMHQASFVVTPARVQGVGSDSGAKGSDLTIRMGRLTKEVCMAINDKLNIENPSGSPPYDTYDCSSAFFVGEFPECANSIGNSVAGLQGKNAFCVNIDSGNVNGYLYLHVLLAR